MSEDVTLVIGGRQVSGWTEVRIGRGIERCPNDFELSITEAYPGNPLQATLVPGEECQLLAGGDLVLTGYVDRVRPRITKRQREIRVSGRGKCQDLVDCSAEWENGQISGSNALEVARKLAEPYGIEVAAAVDPGGPIPQFNLLLGETAWEIIERICRYRALIAYELPIGSLLLNQVATEVAASGFEEGVNVELGEVEYSIDERYSEIQVLRQNVDVLADTGDGGNLIATLPDPNVQRHRRLIVIAETVAQGMGQDVATQRGRWEVARRWGRAFRIEVTVDSWRDQAGQLWAPNTIVPVSLPSLKVPNTSWVIGDVTYKIDEGSGTVARVMIMPAQAFLPQPLPSLQGGFGDVLGGPGALS